MRGSSRITGILCYGGGIFLQAIEGGRMPVSDLYGHIQKDTRHKDIVLLHYEEISERRFGGWTMGQVNMSKINTNILLKYAEKPELDPYSVSGKVSLALRAAFGAIERESIDPRSSNRLEVVHLNEIKGGAAATAHLLAFDTVQGKWRADIAAEGSDAIRINDRRLSFSEHATAAVSGGSAARTSVKNRV